MSADTRMQFTRFGITLQRLEHGDLEMVRQWRNSSWVRPYMRYREVIGPEQQLRWFQGLDAECDWYFIARVGNVPFALFDIKAIDWTTVRGESGGFVGDPVFIGRPEPAQATLALMDFGFRLLRLEFLQVHYSANLPRVVRFNQQLGYLVRREDDGFFYAQVSAERYLQCAASLRQAAMTIHGSGATLTSPPPSLLRRVQQAATTDIPDLQVQLR
jgi:RimJ/RimL family protein N-acetyltransferase